MQNIGQTTAVQFGNALDPRGRANHPKPACARAHGNQVGTVLAKDQSVWSSRNIYTLITGHTPFGTPDQFQRPPRYIVVGRPRKHSRKRLNPEVQYGDDVIAAAEPGKPVSRFAI